MSLNGPGPWLNHLDGISQQFDVLVELDGFGENDPEDKKFMRLLRGVCDVVYDAEKKGAPDLPEIVKRAHALLERLQVYAYTELGMYGSMACFSYSDDCPLVADTLEMAGKSHVIGITDLRRGLIVLQGVT